MWDKKKENKSGLEEAACLSWGGFHNSWAHGVKRAQIC
jgi:hypothetical protein